MTNLLARSTLVRGRSELPALRDSVLADYAGFALYDVLLTSGGSDMQDTDPLTRLRIERISPEDSMGLRDQFQGLRSRDLMSFAGFFNRSFREHDYLWGRLNGADRCVDLLSRAAGAVLDDAGKARLRRELFTTIIDNEAPRVVSVPARSTPIDEEWQYVARAIDLDGDAVSWVFESGPTGAVYASDTQTITWTPTEVATEWFSMRVNDERGAIADVVAAIEEGIARRRWILAPAENKAVSE